MCSFLIVNFLLNSDFINELNKLLKKRGPDLTNIDFLKGYTILHNLLNITGDITAQPFLADNIAITYNGEIYNAFELAMQLNIDIKSDGQILMPLYQKYGKDMFKMLDGEYCIVVIDFNTDEMLLITDTFATKPIYYDITDKKIAISSYYTPLQQLGFSNPKKLKANNVYRFQLSSLNLLDVSTVYEWDLNQTNSDINTWVKTFENAILKRVSKKYNNFICLSSGYDSGAISVCLNKYGHKFFSYTVGNCEKMDTVYARYAILKDNCTYKILDLNKSEFLKHKEDLINNTENFKAVNVLPPNNGYFNYDTFNDVASVGINFICKFGKTDNCRVYLSGSGADEIFSDYGWNGKSIDGYCFFGGKFPDDLKTIFPKNSLDNDCVWKSFYNNNQEGYLMKEEYAGGMNGIEARYPFLDRDCVQAFLNLTVDIKNSVYKNVIDYYLETNHFPYDKNKKLGFNADACFKI